MRLLKDMVSRRSIQRVKKMGVTASGRIGKCGPKRKTSAATDRVIQRLAIASPLATLHQHSATRHQWGVDLSYRTVARRLKGQGFKSARPQ